LRQSVMNHDDDAACVLCFTSDLALGVGGDAVPLKNFPWPRPSIAVELPAVKNPFQSGRPATRRLRPLKCRCGDRKAE
jgi:hypothetical protein